MIIVPDGEYLELYHGTAASQVDSIRTGGLFPPTPPRYPEFWAMLTSNREMAEGFARRTPPHDRAVITYRVPADEVDTYLYPSRTTDLAEHALKLPLPGSMIIAVEVDIPDPPTSPPSS
jgi:hypothetical protein